MTMPKALNTLAPEYLSLIAAGAEKDRLLTDARRIMAEQSRELAALIAANADMSYRLRETIRGRSAETLADAQRRESNRARVRAVCEMLSLCYAELTDLDPTGWTRKSDELARDRGLVVCALRSPDATPNGPMSYPDIAEAMNLRAHSSVIDAERRIKRMFGMLTRTEAA